ncbi:MAG: twin-arginine translocase subunit TatC [Flavobacteriaceae bacterium]|nr:twin-arginine translocase subunit TatC [Flavobacteriaceae bacterium]
MTTTNETSSSNQKHETLLTHLYELRSRLLWIVGSVMLVFIGLFPFANKLYEYLAGPLIKHMPEGSSMVAIDVAAPFLTPFKFVFVLSIVLAIPVILYHVWGFIAPGLYKHEKRLAFPIIISSWLLFYIGMAFAYFIVFPLMFAFFTSVAPEGVTVMTDISRYLDFVLKIFIAFGVAFEVPIITFVLVKLGMTTSDQLATKRPYVIVGAFVVGMLLTPPDIISQFLLAVPVWLLFELGLLMSRVMINNKSEKEVEVSERQEPRFSALTDEDQAIEIDDNELLDEPPEIK